MAGRWGKPPEDAFVHAYREYSEYLELLKEQDNSAPNPLEEFPLIEQMVVACLRDRAEGLQEPVSYH